MSNQQSSDSETLQTTISVDADSGMNEGAPIGFFAVGLAVNVIVIVAYVVWAKRNWNKKSGAREQS